MNAIDIFAIFIFFADLIYFPFWLKGKVENASK